MTTYSKIRLYNKANGLFKGNALLVRTADTIFFVGKSSEFTPDGPDASVPGASFTAGVPVVIRSYAVDALDSVDSFLISVRLTGEPTFLAQYRIELDATVTPVDEVFSVNLDDVFAQETQAASLASGLLIKRAYTQNETYSGFSGYHHNQRVHRFNTPVVADKPWRIGVELEVYARNRDAYNKITSARTNWFQCESDGSLTERQFPIELKTIPLRACDAKSVDFWNEPMRRLGELAISKGCRTTGLHVHISKEILGVNEVERQNNLSKLCTFYTYYICDDPEANTKNNIMCGRERGYSGTLEGTKTPIADFAKKVGINRVAESPEAFKEMSDGIKAGYRNQRWDINVGCWDSYGTIEFRKGDGRISKTRLAAICTWWEQMCLYCKETHPRNFDFNVFFNKVCREYPAVAYFFQVDEEQ